jgi:histidine ammonia-lyase
MADNLARLIAVELMAAAQGIELRRPLRSSAALERAVEAVREVCPFLGDDRPLGEEIEAVAALALGGRLKA